MFGPIIDTISDLLRGAVTDSQPKIFGIVRDSILTSKLSVYRLPPRHKKGTYNVPSALAVSVRECQVS